MPTGGKPRQFAPWHFVSLALPLQGKIQIVLKTVLVVKPVVKNRAQRLTGAPPRFSFQPVQLPKKGRRAQGQGAIFREIGEIDRFFQFVSIANPIPACRRARLTEAEDRPHLERGIASSVGVSCIVEDC